MFIKAQIHFDQHENATVVPVAAIVRRNGIQGLFVADIKQGKARFVPITVGIVNDTQAEIIAPPLTGEVVTLGHHLLEDGGTIILPGRKPRSGAAREGSKLLSPQDSSQPGIQRGKMPPEGKKS
jgi:hypothetical protein